MDKELLFQFMRVKFREAGFSPAETELHMQSFAERYQNQSDEQIEADIRRRGGPSRVAAAAIERRNTVLMADADYRAFAARASAAAANPAADPDRPDTVSDIPSDADAASDAAAGAPMNEKTAPPSAPEQEKTDVQEEDDPLAEWFSADTADEADLSAIFSVGQQKAGDAPTAEIPVVSLKPTSDAPVPHAAAMPENDAQNGAAHTEKPAAPAAEGPAAPPPVPTRDADLGRTRVMGVPPTDAAARPMPQPHRQEAKNPPPRPQNRSDSYQREQQAIWNQANTVRDGDRTPAPAARPLAGTQIVPPAHSAAHSAPNSHQTRTAAHHSPSAQSKKKIEYIDRGTVTRLQEKTYWGEGSEEGVKRFRIIVAAAAPFVLVLLLAYAVLALGLIVGMAALSAAFVLGLVVWVAVGSLIALVSVIYGISRLFSVVPVGLYELGLGVVVIGITMFVGILMYNIAVRLLPFLLRKFIGFQSTFRGFLQDLYYYVKGECYRR